MTMSREAFQNMKRLYCSNLKGDLRKRMAKSLVWSVALYGAETWTLRKQDERRIEAFEMWMWRRMEKISWTDKVRNEEVLRRVEEKRSMLQVVKNRKRNWIGHNIRRHSCLLVEVIEGLVPGKTKKGRRRYKMSER